jgi:hypothetical protein
MVGPIIGGIPDDTINRMIHRASNQLIYKYYGNTNPYGSSYTDVPDPVYRWVTCTAGIMALNASIATGGAGGNTTKRLGSFAVSYEGDDSGATPADVRKSLMDCINQSDRIISSLLRRSSAVAVKSLYNTYIRHPLKDPAWGRLPRMRLDDGLKGPWENSHEFGDYTRSSNTT